MGQKFNNELTGISVRLNMHLPAEIIKEADIYVSSCPVLDIFSQGETEEEAKSNLIEAVTAFITSCINRGTLDAVLKQCGFKTVQGVLTHPQDNAVDYIDVPIPMLAAYEKQCHA